jgi:hypothetical protein
MIITPRWPVPLAKTMCPVGWDKPLVSRYHHGSET